MTAEIYLRGRALSASVGGRQVLDAVDIEVARGEFVAVVGPNGAGKSTLLRVLVGFQRASGGEVEVDGRGLRAWSARQRARRVAFVEQESSGFADLLVSELVALGRLPAHPPWRSAGAGEAAAVSHALAAVDLTEHADRSMSQLSGGERRRALLARALAQDTELIVLDEPTNHLDIRHQHALLRRVRTLGRTVVAALHDLDTALVYADRVVMVSDGQVVATGPAAEVLRPDLVESVFGVPAAHVRHPVTGRTRLVVGDF